MSMVIVYNAFIIDIFYINVLIKLNKECDDMAHENQSNWEKLKDRLPSNTMRFRDVYDDQQLDRTRVKQRQTMKTRNIANIAMSIFFFFVFYLILSVMSTYSHFVHGVSDPSYTFGMAVNSGFGLTFGKIFFDIVGTAVFYAVMHLILVHNLDAQNLLNDTSDINQYQNDQHIALPEEIQRNFDWFPDVGATSDVQFSSMISHMAISNKGLKTIQVAQRASSDILDEDGDIVTYKGEILTDDEGNVLYEEKPLIDIDFMNDLFDASGLPNQKNLRKFFNTTMIPYNADGSNRDKLGKFATVADLINADWEFPYYEPQRPGGAYIVDTAPVNTMV